MVAHVRSLPDQVPTEARRPEVEPWEDIPLRRFRMDFRSYEAEMAAQRGEKPERSPLNTKPGARVRINRGWSASWLTDQRMMKQKFERARSPQPAVSTWRVKGWG